MTHELRAKQLLGSDKVRGLIGSKNAHPVLINTRFGIHTFGLKFPIDVLILDKDNRVVKVSENLLPNRIFLWPPVFDKVLELPAGEIGKNKIQRGDTIKIIIIY